ncbi:MAG: NAD-dependent epimerase/dehydratase family protein [Gemmatimonadota bacterium]
MKSKAVVAGPEMPPLPNRWLITGGCGFIGSVLTRELARRGVRQMRILDDLSRGSIDSLDSAKVRVHQGSSHDLEWLDGIDVVIGAVENRSEVDRVMVGAEVIVHLAANAGVVQSMDDPLRDMEVNVSGSVTVLDSARRAGASRVVLASSAAAVGAAEPPVSEDSLPRPSTPYGAGKLATEAYAGAFFQAFGLEAVPLRFGNVYGPYSQAKDSVVARFIRQWKGGETWVLYGDGEQTRDFVYIFDLIDAVIRAAVMPGVGGKVFQIATNRETSINELAVVLADAIEVRGFSRPSFQHGPPRAGDVRRNYSDTSLAGELLGWQAATPLKEGLGATVDWFLDPCFDEGGPIQ